MKVLKRNECAILYLTLKAKWYGLIIHGDKLEEYRDYKPYWHIRIRNWHDKQRFGWDRCDKNKWLVVAFSRGRQKADRFYLTRYTLVRESDSEHPEWGEPKEKHYVLGIGERVELVD